MKKFYAILIVFLCFYTLCVADVHDKKKQETQQKMEQLKHLLQQVSNNVPLPSNNINNDDQVAGNIKSDKTNTMQKDITTGQQSNSEPSSPSTSDALVDNSDTKLPQKPPTPYDQAFANVVNQMLPMSSQQIAKLREVFMASQLAVATPPGIPPKPTSSALLIDLSPKAIPPVIRLGAGYITSLVFVDSTGQPWPLASYSIGDPASFNIQWDRKGNTLLIQSMTFYKRSNLAVILRDLNTPIMITLISGQEALDYRVDLRVPGLGPNAVFTQNNIPDAANPILLDVLNGLPPSGSKKLKVNGGDCQAWIVNNDMYLRTRLNVISPGWKATMSSIDGTRAYQLQQSPIVLALQNGTDKKLTLNIESME